MVDVVLMRVDRALLRQTRHPRHRYPPLDLMTVRAQLMAVGRSVELLDGWLETLSFAEQVDRILAATPRLVVLHASGWAKPEAIALGRVLRSRSITTVASGQQVADQRFRVDAEWQDAFDLDGAGDVEAWLADRIERLFAGGPLHSIAPAPTEQFEVADTQKLPFPRWSSADLACYPFPFPLVDQPPLRRWGYVMGAWGCPRPCRHCSAVVRKSSGRRLVTRGVDEIVAEVVRLQGLGAEAISFEDDSLFVNRPRLQQLLSALESRQPPPWMANARPDELDEGVIDSAWRAGLRLLKIGVDAALPQQIELIGKSGDGAAWIENSVKLFAALRARGVTTVALLMVGLPAAEGTDEEQAILNLLRRLRPDYLQLQIYHPYPDSQMWQEAAVGVADYHYPVAGDGNSGAATSQRRIYRRFYLDPRYLAGHLWRCRRFYLGGGGSEVAAGVRFLLGTSRTLDESAVKAG